MGLVKVFEIFLLTLCCLYFNLMGKGVARLAGGKIKTKGCL
jgi:hypothetical protein